MNMTRWHSCSYYWQSRREIKCNRWLTFMLYKVYR